MIVPVEDLLELPEFSGKSEKALTKKLKAIEFLIRAYTNNNFQNRLVRFSAKSLGDRCFGSSPFLSVGDTVQISKSGVNDGLYSIVEKTDSFIRLDSKLYDIDLNLITKIEYPEDVRQGVLELMIWEAQNRQKVGIKSETISRHSVTYFDQDASNQKMGYPLSLLGFLQPYLKPRF